MAKSQDKEYVEIRLQKLKPHPRNAELYTKRSRWQVEELAENMDKNGLDEAVEVTADMIIISGHERLAAAKLLGWKTIRCWIRRDLTSPEAVEMRLVEANLYRRQLSKLDMVRSYQHLKRLSKNGRGRSLSKDEATGDLRDIIAKRFGASGRTLDRWLQVLRLPMPLQQSVDEGSLKLTEAVKVAALDKKDQIQIADQITGVSSRVGDDIKRRTKAIKAILDGHLHKGAKGQHDVGSMLNRLVNSLNKGRAELGHRVKEVKVGLLGPALENLRNGRTFIDALITQMENNSKETARKLKPCKADFDDEEE